MSYMRQLALVSFHFKGLLFSFFLSSSFVGVRTSWILNTTHFVQYHPFIYNNNNQNIRCLYFYADFVIRTTAVFFMCLRMSIQVLNKLLQPHHCVDHNDFLILTSKHQKGMAFFFSYLEAPLAFIFHSYHAVL